MNHSYVMGVTSSILTLKEQGFIIEKDGDNYMVSFDKDKSPIWEEFISKNLKLGFWNEYIQDGIVVFLFHLKDGIKRYEVHFYNNDEVLSLCEKLCGCKFPSIYQMIIDNHFYSRFLK